MMLGCACLNVTIEPESNDLSNVTREALELTESEGKDGFFNQELLQTQQIGKVHNKIPALVTVRKVGPRWVIYQCINCNIHTHASYAHNKTSFILVSAKLLNDEAMAATKESSHFSPIFGITVTKPNACENEKSNILPIDSEAVINSLRQRMNECINMETAAMEIRLRKYTEEQQRQLEEYKDRIYKEHHMLKMKILERKSDSSFKNHTSTNIKKLPQSNQKSFETVPDLINPDSAVTLSTPITNNKFPAKKQHNDSFSRSVSYDQSYDSDMFFPLDMHEEPTLDQFDFDDSDQEDLPKDDNSEHKQKPIMHLAKSLPVNIPVFMSAYQNHVNEDNDDDDLPDESMDIAASIKALAKSIQGGTVFGELPRSRFSSQI